MDVEDFKEPIRAYLRRKDLGRLVVAKPREDGDWNVWFRDHGGRLQKLTVSDSEIFQGPPTAGECNCAHAHPSVVPTTPCPQHGHKTHAAEESVPVVYEASSREASAVEPGPMLRWHRKRNGYEAKGRMGVYEIIVRKPDRRRGILPVVLHITPAIYQFNSIGEAKDFAKHFDHVAPYTMRRPSNDTAWAGENAAMPHVLVAPKIATALLPGHGLNPVGGRNGDEWRIRDNDEVIWRGKSEDAAMKALDDLGVADDDEVFGGYAVEWRPGNEKDCAWRLYGVEEAQESRRRRDSRSSRKKADEGGGDKSVSRWVHWTLTDRGKTYVGKGQVTGNSYRVTILPVQATRSHRSRRAHPYWMLFTPVPGVGGVFSDANAAMLHADKMEANAGSIPHGAEVPLTKTPLVTLKRDFKKYEACTASSKRLGAIDSPKKIWQLLSKTMLDEPQEVFVVVPLNIHDQLSDCPVEAARGAKARVEVDPAIILEAALAANADSFAVVHNHPGSRPDPSDADKELTRTIEKATKALESIEFREHYIISAKGVYSIRAGKMWHA